MHCNIALDMDLRQDLFDQWLVAALAYIFNAVLGLHDKVIKWPNACNHVPFS